MKSVAAVILAAGKGTRMKSKHQNKVVKQLANKPMITYAIDAIIQAGIQNIIVVVGFASDSVKQAITQPVVYATQSQPLGTGHALKVGLKKIPPQVKQVISMYGDDSAFYSAQTLTEMITFHQQTKAAITFMSVKKTDPTGLGRIIRDSEGNVTAIVEEKNATPDQKKITEINTGLYCFDRAFLDNSINQITKNSVAQEYYLTDIVEIARKQGKKITALLWPDPSIWFGVNTPQQLSQAKKIMQQKLA